MPRRTLAPSAIGDMLSRERRSITAAWRLWESVAAVRCRLASAARWHRAHSSSRPLVPGIGTSHSAQVAPTPLQDGWSGSGAGDELRAGDRAGAVGDRAGAAGDRAGAAGEEAAELGSSALASGASCGRPSDSRSSSVSRVRSTSSGILPDARPIFGAHPNITSYGRRPMP